jgi:hypothetical protein
MTRLFIRFLRRLLIFALGIFSIWLIVFVFRFVDARASWILALAATYGMAAYVILPRAVRMGSKSSSANMCRATPLPVTDCQATPST